MVVSFTSEGGIEVYADGVKIPDEGWAREEGNLDKPSQAKEAYLLQNQEPWVLGADTSRTKVNETAAEFRRMKRSWMTRLMERWRSLDCGEG